MANKGNILPLLERLQSVLHGQLKVAEAARGLWETTVTRTLTYFCFQLDKEGAHGRNRSHHCFTLLVPFFAVTIVPPSPDRVMPATRQVDWFHVADPFVFRVPRANEKRLSKKNESFMSLISGLHFLKLKLQLAFGAPLRRCSAIWVA